MSTSQNPQKNQKKNHYHHGSLRSELLNHAARMIREQGEEALSMRKLADSVGVSRTAAYHHFKDKQDLLCAVAEEGFRRFDQLSASVDSETRLEDYLDQHIRSYIAFAVNNKEYYNLMFGGRIWKSQVLTASLKKLAYASFQHQVDQMEEVCKNCILPDGVTPLRFSQIVWSTLHGLSRLMIDGIYVEQTAIDAICDASVKVLVEGISGESI